MRKLVLLKLILLFILNSAYAQNGKLLVIGGGSEESGTSGWNALAYQWAVDQSDNKKVAVISYSNDSPWLSDHFVSDWGAAESAVFVIGSQSEANTQSVYDTLMQYDVIFLKGGDQYNYYSDYKDTKTEQAVTDKFNEGGVICGTSAGLAVLGGVDFVAGSGTVYPYECLENWNNQYVTLENDFLPFLEGVIFDSHFVQRGRFPRLLGFMAHWQTNNSETLTGIGVDDKTALAIDADNNATAYGSGCVNVYHTKNSGVLEQEQTKLLVDSISVTQLVDGTSINLSNFEVSGFDNKISPENMEETGNYTVFASGGSNKIEDNQELLKGFASKINNTEDTLLILTGNNQDTAGLFEDHLNSLGIENTDVYPATSVYSDNVALEEAIKKSDRFLFVKAKWSEFSEFIDGSNGELLQEKIKETNTVSAFIGENSRYLGESVVTNYSDPNASYDGTYGLADGLGLLSVSVIIPKTYAAEFEGSYSQYENTAAAVPYTMVQDSLTYGIWLTRNNYIKFQPEGGENFLNAYGEWPVMVLKNEGTNGEIVSRGVSGENTSVRMLGGFENMKLSVIDSTMPYKMGDTKEEEPVAITPEIKDDELEVYLENARNRINIRWPGHQYRIHIYNSQGQVILTKENMKNSEAVYYPEVPSGVYILRFEDDLGNFIAKKLFLN